MCSTWASLEAVSAAFQGEQAGGPETGTEKALQLGALTSPENTDSLEARYVTKLGFSQHGQFTSQRGVSKEPGLSDRPHRISHSRRPCSGPWVRLGLLSKKTLENRLLQPLPHGSQGRQAPQEEARLAHDLESSSECDRPSHPALKIEGALPPAFPIHLGQVPSALSEVALGYKRGRRHPPGLRERFRESPGCRLHGLSKNTRPKGRRCSP